MLLSQPGILRAQFSKSRADLDCNFKGSPLTGTGVSTRQTPNLPCPTVVARNSSSGSRANVLCGAIHHLRPILALEAPFRKLPSLVCKKKSSATTPGLTSSGEGEYGGVAASDASCMSAQFWLFLRIPHSSE